MRVLIFITGLLFLFFFSNIAVAIPFLHDPQPTNNSYTTGGTIVLSINITDSSLDTNAVIVKILELSAYQQGEEWVTQGLSCTGGPSEWKCSKNFVTSTIGSDTVELFYFEANDTSGVKGNNGTASKPLRFTIDREPPMISFVNPVNGTYVSGNETLSITIADGSSGVNNNTAQYSSDGNNWTGMKNVTLTLFEATWNTTTFSNNQSVELYVKAFDNINNGVTSKINVTVDNEIPQIVSYPLSGTLSGNALLQANVSDSYSGIDLGNVKYSVDSLSGTLGCMGSNYSATCSAVLDTANLQDGNHTLTFTVIDRAGNLNSSSIQIKTSNTQPRISIIEPVNNAYLKGTILVRAAIANAEGIVNYVEISVERSGNISTKNMICDSGFTSCNYSLDTTSLIDGGYTIRASAMNNSGAVVVSSISVTIDNTKPSLTIIQPITDIKGDFEIKVDVIDSNLNQNKVWFNISSFNGGLVCTPQTPSRFICSTAFNSRQLTDGKYALNVSAEDKAGNLGVASREINIVNQGVSRNVSGSNQSIQQGSETTAPTKEVEIGETVSEKQKETRGISFKSEYIIMGIVLTAVILVIIILAITFIRRTGETIITEK